MWNNAEAVGQMPVVQDNTFVNQRLGGAGIEARNVREKGWRGGDEGIRSSGKSSNTLLDQIKLKASQIPDRSALGLNAIKSKLYLITKTFNVSRSFAIGTLVSPQERELLVQEEEQRVARMSLNKAKGCIIKDGIKRQRLN